ncbi:MAG: hypothetical protein ISS36_02525 [Candidatus Aenigmarchaeota archaeon]|nr:hypothetical protein [Candidatus Aenigmarchaeota archaeon]
MSDKIPLAEVPDLVRLYTDHPEDTTLADFLEWIQREEAHSIITSHGHVYKGQAPDFAVVITRDSERDFCIYGMGHGGSARVRLTDEDVNRENEERMSFPPEMLDAMEEDAKELLETDEYRDQTLEYVIEEGGGCTSPSTIIWNPNGEVIY